MHIKINEDYNVVVNTALLGYVGETNARPVSVEGMEVDGADRYVLTIDYGDGVQYEVDITGGQWTPTADILRSAQTVSCQICAKKLSGQEYILVKKSRIFRLRIGAAIGDNAVPSPSVAADALDKIDAIGTQVAADRKAAETAAETATTAANNAAKSATSAGLSADTATQAASRAETAKAAAETSATQAETAMQGAETARAEAVTSQNAAKVSAAQAATSAQQTTADKNITAGYTKTAKTCADSTTADRQAVQTLAEQVTADKANVAENAAKVAEDRAAAETAAQTAQSIADSLPEDYTTAVGKIAENTVEIGRIKLTDKELQRRVNALYDMGNGVTHKFETDSETAYAKTVPTGAKLMSVKNIGGRSLVWNQMCSTFTYQGTECNCKPVYSAHKYLCRIDCEAEQGTTVYMYFREVIYTKNNQISKAVNAGKSTLSWITSPYGDSDIGGTFDAFLVDGSAKVTFSNRQIFDLTLMFGSGNEPASVEEFEKMFPNDYYPYNAGEIISAGVTEVAVGDSTYPIPEAIRNLHGYGWSAGTAKNYVDYENKRYVQCVNSVDLGTKNWLMYKDGDYTPFFYLNGISDIRGGTSNFLCPKYQYVKIGVTGNESGLYVLENTTVRVRDTAYTDAATFKQAMSGVMLYYELESPIVTDISTLIDDDFLRNIEAESGGSVTFKNSNDNYHIPVPSEEEYIVKLSEVGGTT
uniref:hypothetical protein n=1 Tax=Ruminococcus bicirculans (ex Wegman et al. 2014) TaxID=1160721 RepID=UPI004029D0F5